MQFNESPADIAREMSLSFKGGLFVDQAEFIETVTYELQKAVYPYQLEQKDQREQKEQKEQKEDRQSSPTDQPESRPSPRSPLSPSSKTTHKQVISGGNNNPPGGPAVFSHKSGEHIQAQQDPRVEQDQDHTNRAPATSHSHINTRKPKRHPITRTQSGPIISSRHPPTSPVPSGRIIQAKDVPRLSVAVSPSRTHAKEPPSPNSKQPRTQSPTPSRVLRLDTGGSITPRQLHNNKPPPLTSIVATAEPPSELNAEILDSDRAQLPSHTRASSGSVSSNTAAQTSASSTGSTSVTASIGKPKETDDSKSKREAEAAEAEKKIMSMFNM